MDEEDDPLLGKRLETTERYDTLQMDAKRRLHVQQPLQSGASAIPEFSLPNDWVLPVNNSIGVKLLKQMGWKEGHGIGQRVRRRKFDAEDKESSKRLLQGDNEPKTESQDEEEVYVPPRKVFDVQASFPKPKLDQYGAGFDPYRDAPEFSIYKQQQENKIQKQQEAHRHVVSFVDALKTTDGNNSATNGYGLSALEENDDIDVYGTVSMAEFDRVIAPLGVKHDAKRLESSRHEPLRRSRALCSDGRSVLPGFELAAAREKPPKRVNLHLTVPSDFKAYHRFDDTSDQCEALYRKYQLSTDNASHRMVVTAKQRGKLLGDATNMEDEKVDAYKSATACGETKELTGSVFDLLGKEQKTKLFDAAAQAKQSLLLPNAKRATSIEVPAARKIQQPFVNSRDGEQFRATISASIAKRFVSSTSTSTAEGKKIDFVARTEPHAKASHRSQSLWIPKSLLCKRFHVKCVGPTGSNGRSDSHEKKQDLFDKELVPHLMEYAADRAAHQKSNDETRDVLKLTEASTAKLAGEGDLPPLALVDKAPSDLLKSIFEPSDESLSEDESEDESDDGDSIEQGNNLITEARSQHSHLSQLASPTPSPARIAVNGERDRCRIDSQESNSSGDDDTATSSVIIAGTKKDGESLGLARADDSFDREARRRAKEERKKHKRRHTHRISRDEKVKRRKKDKKERKERKSHRHHTSKHSRRRGSPRAKKCQRSGHEGTAGTF